MWRCAALAVLISVAGSETIQVEVRNSEVWLIRDGAAQQLTHDGKSKWQALLSPQRDEIAYYESCPQAEHCTPSVVILDLEGRRVKSFQVLGRGFGPPEPCMSINSISWIQQSSIAADCHITPSAGEYIETDIATGKVVRDLFGLDFTPSPDGQKVAHVGGIIHFAPPYAQSYYLQVENTTIYPLPEGVGPVEQEKLVQPPSVVRNEGSTYYGIHEFSPGLSWSPDSQRIALIDCTFDWTAKDPSSLSPVGTVSNRRCFITVVALDGKYSELYPIEASELRTQNRDLSWVNAHELVLEINGSKKSIPVP